MQKRDAVFPLISALISIAVIGGAFGGLWWFTTQGKQVPLEKLLQSQLGTSSEGAEGEAGETLVELVTLESPENLPQGLFNYGGSTTMIPIREVIEPAIQQSLPDFQLRYTSPIGQNPGSGTGVQMLLEGQLAFSESSRPLKAKEYDQAKLQGGDLRQIPVAIDGIAVAAHPDLETVGLTLEQLRAIYLGDITNWSDVGGPNLAVKPFSRLPDAGGTPEFFQSTVLQGDDFGESVSFVETTTIGLQQTAQTPGGIYFASAPEVVPQCLIQTLPIANTEEEGYVAPYQDPPVSSADCPEQRNQVNAEAFKSGDYPLTRRLFVIIKTDGSIDEQAGRAYADILLSPNGQTLIEQAGFVSIR